MIMSRYYILICIDNDERELAILAKLPMIFH